MLIDTPEEWPLLEHKVEATGALFQFVTDTVVGPDGTPLVRNYLRHPGAVSIVALDDQERIVLVKQYRHPVGRRMVEIPAGLLDHFGEDYWEAAKRELAEEAQLAASDWRIIADFATSPGCTDEMVRIFLARGLTEVPRPVGFVIEGEELDMQVQRVPLAQVVQDILSGNIQNPSLIAGVMTVWAHKDHLDDLRAPDVPWPSRTALERRREQFGI